MVAQATRIRRGIEVLDTTFPKWRQYFDASRVNTASLYECPLGQAAQTLEGYDERYDTAWGYGMWRAFGVRSANLAIDHGFEVRHDESYAELDAAWHEVLAEEGIV